MITLQLDEIEYERYRKFGKEHYDKHHFHGGVPVTITPTGIGDHVEVKCPFCEETKDISNYEVW
jgi:hypothetical protein